METAKKVIKCKAAVAWGLHPLLSIEDIEVAPPKAHEVRIKMVATGICPIDDPIIEDIFCKKTIPVILGHEGAGIVESVGEGVTKFSPGDKVILSCVPQCEECKCCKHPKSNYCINMSRLSSPMPDQNGRFTCKGKVIHQFVGASTLSEYSVVDEGALIKVNDAAPLDRVCLIGCAFSTGYGTVVNAAKVTPGSSCAVFGLGGVGLSAIIGCKVSGASRIIAIANTKSKFARAREMGATECISVKDCTKPIHEVVCELTDGGVDYSFECVGNNTDIMVSALQSCQPGYGTCVLTGANSPDAKISFDPMLLLTGRTFKGCIMGGLKPHDTFPQLVSDYMEKKYDLDGLVTHTLPFSKINEGFDHLRAGKCVRCIIMF